jgi:hypothetical protein
MFRFITALAIIFCTAAFTEQEVKVLESFEDESALAGFEFKQKSATLVDSHVTHGKKCVKVSTDEYIFWSKVPQDISGYDALEIDVFVEGSETVAAIILIADTAWRDKKDYWNRYNSNPTLVRGMNKLSIPVDGLFRGEAGSRNNDIKKDINPKTIVRFDLGFAKGGAGAIFVDNIRLIRQTAPEGILAFDFGPESQNIFPAFTPISFNTVYGKDGKTAGLRVAASTGTARDDTFPTRLYQDFLEMANDGSEFVCNAPDGLYHAWLVYDDCGYWGGEAAKHSRRSIINDGKEVFIDERGAEGPTDSLFRFEQIEPRPGMDVWDTYLKGLFKGHRFLVRSVGGKIALSFKADARWSSKVAALVIYAEANKETGDRWIAEIEARNKKEFETRAVFVGEKAATVQMPEDAVRKGYWLGSPLLSQKVSFQSNPGNAFTELARTATTGQRVSMTFAIRPAKDLGTAKLTCSDLKFEAGTISASTVDLRYVMHLTKRSFNDIAYEIAPDSLRKVDGANLKLEANLTRQFWITVHVPIGTLAGIYRGELTLAGNGIDQKIPLKIEVLDLVLDEPDFGMGYLLTGVPGVFNAERKQTAFKELLELLRENGMNTLAGGPNVPFKGLDEAGKPILDFTACDDYFAMLRKTGFKRELIGYGGPGFVTGLHDHYVIGQTGRKWEKDTGKTFNELLKLVWTAVHEHAKQNQWLPVAHPLTDEPRTIEQAAAQLELMSAYRDVAPFVRIGGLYSVHWGNMPLDKAIQNIFSTLVWSGLNVHSEHDMRKAREAGREVYIYNQGVSRFSFGMYQWAEMRKGVKARIQWALLALHGYQYFDLDGRERDTAMINWGRNTIHPTVNLARCREGSDDLRFAVTLYNQATQRKDAPDAKAALEFLESINRLIPAGAREPLKDIDDEQFRNTCIDYLKRLRP